GNNNNKLQYLGFEFDGKNIYLRSASMSKYERRLHQQVNRVIKTATKNTEDVSQIRVFKRRLYQKFTEKGKRNFIKYANRAGKHILKSPTVQRQSKNSIKRVEKIIQRKLQKLKSITGTDVSRS